MIKLSIKKLQHLNICLLVVLTEDDEIVELLLCKGTSSDSSTAKLFLSLHTKTIKLGKFWKVKSNKFIA